MDMLHLSVMPAEVIQFLEPATKGIYVDGNLGLGGHAGLILEASSPDGRVIGFEWDEEALMVARERLDRFGSRAALVRRNFTEVQDVLQDLGIAAVDGLLLDLGVSSLQLDNGSRGFSFRGNEPLDMRMDTRRRETAADLVNTLSQEDLADVLFHFGEERQARRIAGHLVDARKKERIETTGQLADLIAQAVPKRFHPQKIHVATRSFQALRIAVNDELNNLATILKVGANILKPGGRFVVISFHSLEDRLVKLGFRNNTQLKPLTKKPVRPSEEEVFRNHRARSACLRVAEKIH